MASKPNGHALAFAEAFQGMVYDTVKPMIDGVNNRIGKLEIHMVGRIDDLQKQLNTTNGNMQVQLAQHRKDMSSDVRKIIRRGS